ncbi:MAG: hypothetical protein IJO70_02235 [Lachnospiraceae bacterium]|nr:hypothetical protein [Lachnospiraceae bacterium]
MKKSLVGIIICSLGCSLLLTGCGKSNDQERANIRISEYEKITYETVSVERGDIVPTLTLEVTSDTFQRKNYFPRQDEMEVDQIYVTEGDMVSEGQTLVSFKAGDISEQITSYENQRTEDQLLIDHYTKLMEIDSEQDYTEAIKALKQDMEVCSLYIQELNAKLESYSIKAEGNGTVIMVSDLLDYGVVNSGDNVLTLIYGTGEYYATTTDDYDFKVDEIYEATYANSTYSLRLVSIEELEGEEGRKLNFTMAVDGVTGVEKMAMVLNKPALKDVLYVPEDCVFYVEESAYVYTLDENGFREAISVTVGQTIEGMTVIETGLDQGEKVVIN